ncbi:hypothetical protein JCM3775_005487 [Rhodotorula graminis]
MPGSWHPPDPSPPPTGLCRPRRRPSLITDAAPASTLAPTPCARPPQPPAIPVVSTKRCRACASRGGDDGVRDGTPSADLAPPRRCKRRAGRISAATPLRALAALVAAATAPATTFASPAPRPPPPPPVASPTSHRPPPSSVSRPTDVAIGEPGDRAAPPAPSARSTGAPRPRPRAVPPRYTLSDSQWVEDYGWSLLGRGTAQPSATLAAAAQGESGDEVDGASEVSGGGDDDAAGYRTTLASALADSAPTATASLPDSTSPTATSDSSLAAAEMAAQPSDSASLAAAASSSPTHDAVKIPDGWQAKSRETDYYAVPIIIAMSVLVAVIVVVSIFVSVLMRRKKRRRAKRRHGKAAAAAAKELEGEKGWRGMVDSALHPVRTARAQKGKKRARESAAAGGEGAGAGAATQGGSGSGGSAGAYRRVRATAVAASASRARTRRRRRRDGDDEGDEDEATALTRTDSRSTTSSVAHDTLTARLSARMRGDRPSTGSSGGSGAAGTGAATVFSRDVTSRSQVSLTASALSRVSSRASNRTSRSVAAPSSPTTPAPPELLFTPADDPTLPNHLPIPGSSAPSVSSPLARERSASAPAPILPPAVSSFGALITTDALPAPGPPAYRPSSSTVQNTRRYGAGDVAAPPSSQSLSPSAGVVAERPRARRVFGRRRVSHSGTTAGEGDDGDAGEGEWHWPGEKGRPFAGEVPHAAVAGPSSPQPPPLDGDSAEPDLDGYHVDEAHPPVDRALFSAHVATDDKAVLARLRAQRDARADVSDDDDDALASSSAGLNGPVPAPSAPVVDEDDDPEVDEDGFERYDAGPSASASSADVPSTTPARAWPAASTSFLPTPPKPIQQSSFAYSTASAAAPSSPLLASRSTTPAPSPGPSKAALAAEYGAAEADEDVDALPQYLAGGSAGREALGLASAPLGSGDEEDDEASGDELEDAEAGVARRAGWRNEGEREEEAVV